MSVLCDCEGQVLLAINKLSLRLHYFNRINVRSFSSVSFELRLNDIDLCPILILYIGCLARKVYTCKIVGCNLKRKA